ncbi:MAG: YqaE/Pmp3 family membrane protein [Anaerolineae bacterium]|nr:YqaE/Pmp3 family membrane protein [Anaerolineae bacterium]
MGCIRLLLCLIFPPLAVVDRGCGTVLIVFALTLAGWLPGVAAALVVNAMITND